MNDADSILKLMDETMAELDRLILPDNEEVGEYAKKIANSEYLEQKRKFVLAEEAEKCEGSEARKKSKAEASQTFKDHLMEEKRAKGFALQAKAVKDLLEHKLDILRSKLAYLKSTIDQRI